jgi:hypothetical protein
VAFRAVTENIYKFTFASRGTSYSARVHEDEKRAKEKPLFSSLLKVKGSKKREQKVQKA